MLCVRVCVCRGEYALAEYTEVKAITIKLTEQLRLIWDAFIHNCICQSNHFSFPLNPFCTSLGLFYVGVLYRWKEMCVFICI